MESDQVRRPSRKRNRLPGYDYSSNGAYFITFCTKNKAKMLSSISDPEDAFHAPSIILSPCGVILNTAVLAIHAHYPQVFPENYVIMPNHVHLLLRIDASDNKSPSIDRIVGQLKRVVTMKCGYSPWQKGYHDHIIRGDADFWQYISDNPVKWIMDKYYVA